MIDFRLAYLPLALISLVLFLLTLGYRLWRHKPVTYNYALATYLKKNKLTASSLIPLFFLTLRVTILGLLVFLIGKPQVPDRRTQTHVEGIDIIIVLDASGSMVCFDDANDRKSRMQVAKEEALRFIERRENDAIGLVTFANGALTACPLTHDKAVLKEIIDGINIGSMVDDRATLLSYGILTALNRLKNSTSVSKVIILLTDGQPSMHDAPIHVPLAIAQKLGVKIYTIGVGNEHGGFYPGPHGMIVAQGAQLNEQLLKHIAQQTHGVFYHAQNAAQMRDIYQTIDQLEKQKLPINMYQRYYDIFEPFLWIIILLVSIEITLSTFVWKML